MRKKIILKLTEVDNSFNADGPKIPTIINPNKT